MSDALSSIPVANIKGQAASLNDWKGKVRLVVNVASACGLTPQYEGLQKLQEAYADRGFTVLGFPANDFGAQEPGSNEEIADFCATNYAVTFPMFAKISVKGSSRHPLYDNLIKQAPVATAQSDDFRAKLESYGIKVENESDVMWNFEKFLIARDGRVAARFRPDVAPDSPLLTKAIEAELAK